MTDSMATFVFPLRASSSALSPGSSTADSGSQRTAFSPLPHQHPVHHDPALPHSDDDPEDLDLDDDSSIDGEEHTHVVVQAVRQSRPSRARLLSVHELQARARDSDPHLYLNGPLDLPPLPARPLSPSSTATMSDALTAATSPAPYPSSRLTPLHAWSSRSDAPPLPADADEPASAHDKQVEQEQSPALQLTTSPMPISVGTAGVGLHTDSLPTPEPARASSSAPDNLRPPSSYSALDVLAGSAMGPVSPTPSPPLSAPSPWRPSRQSLLDVALDIYADDAQDVPSSPPQHSSLPSAHEHVGHEAWWRTEPSSDKEESDSDARDPTTDTDDERNEGEDQRGPMLPMHLHVLDDPFGMAPLPSLRNATPGPPILPSTEGLSPNHTPGQTLPLAQRPLSQPRTPGSPTLTLPAEHVEELTDQEDPSLSASRSGSAEHLSSPHLGPPLSPNGSYFSSLHMKAQPSSNSTSPGEDRTEERMALLRAELADAESKLEAAQVANETESVTKLEEKAAGLRKALLAHHSAAMSRQSARIPTPASQPRPSIASTAEPLDPEPATEPKSTPATTSGPSDRAVPQAQPQNNSLIVAAAAALGQGQDSSSNINVPDGISFAAAMQIIALRAGSMESELEAARKRAEDHANLVEQHRVERETLQQRVKEWEAKHHAHLATEDQTKVQHQEVLDQLKAEHDSRLQELEAALVRAQEDAGQRLQEERTKWERVLSDAQAQAEQRTTELLTQSDDALMRQTALEAQHATVRSERDDWATKHADLSQAHDALQGQLDQAHRDRDAVREEHKDLSIKYEQLLGNYDEVVRSRNEVQGQHALLVTEHGTLQATHAKLSGQKLELDRSVQELTTQLESAEQERDNLRSDLAQRTNEYEALQARTTQLEAEQQAAEQAKAELRNQLDQAQASLTSKDERLTELETQLAAQPDHTAEAEAAPAEAEAAKRALQSQLDQAKELLATKDAHVVELEKQVAATPKALPEPTALASVTNEPASRALDLPEPSVSTESAPTSRALESAEPSSPSVAAQTPMPMPGPPSFAPAPSDPSNPLPSLNPQPRDAGLAQSYYDSFDQGPDQQPADRSLDIASLPDADRQPTLSQSIARAEAVEHAEAESRTASQMAETQLANLTTRLEEAVQRTTQAEQRTGVAGAIVAGAAPESTDLRTQLVQAQAQIEAAQAEAQAAKAELDHARQAFAQSDVPKAARLESVQSGSVPVTNESSGLPELATLQAQNESLRSDLAQAQQQLTRQVSSGGLDTPDGWQVVTPDSRSFPQIVAKDVGSTAASERALVTDPTEQTTSTEFKERELPGSSTESVPTPEASGISQDSHALQLRAELAEGKLEELRRAHRELLDKHHTVRTEALEATTSLVAAKQAAQKLQDDYDAAQEEAAMGVDKLHHLAEVEAQLRAAQRKAEEAAEDLTWATEQHKSQRAELEKKLTELQPQLEQAERDNSELRAFKAHADDVGASQRQERDEAISRADKAERGLRQLELAVAAERRILAEREGLFSAFERRLESAEARLGEEDRRCAQMLGKVDGREEMDNLLLQIKGVVPPNQRETAGQNIDSLISSLSEHITDAFDELERRGCRVHRPPGDSRSLYSASEDEDADTDVGLWEKSSDTAQIGKNKPDINVAMAQRLDEVLATVSRYEHEVAEQAKASKATDAELKSLEAERVAMKEATAQLRQALDVARQEAQERAVEVTMLEERLAKAQAGSVDAQGDQLRDLGETADLSALQTKARTLQRTVSSLEEELAASRTLVAELETRLVSALRSRKTGSTGTQQDEHLELPGLATRLDAAERTALEAQHARAELSAEASVLRVECERLASERTRLLAALEAASAKQPPTIETNQDSMEMLAPEPQVEQRSRWSVSDVSPSKYHLGDGEGEAGLSHRTLAPMSSPSTQPSAREATGEALASPAQLAVLREEHSRLRVQFDSLHEQYTRLRTEHEQVSREAASLRVELQSAKADRAAAEATPKSSSSPVAATPHGSEMAELLALFPHATSHGVGASEPSVTPSMAATTDLSPLPDLRRLADTWPSPANRSQTPAGVTVSAASSTASGKVDVSSLRSRFEQQSTNPSSPVADRNTPLSTPGYFGVSLPTPATPISRPGSTPPVPHPRPPSSASGRTSKHNPPLDWSRIVSDVKEMRSTIVALRSQVSSAQQEKVRIESVLSSLRQLLDRSFVGGESGPDTSIEGDVPFAHLDEALGLSDRAPGPEMPSPVLSYTSVPTGSLRSQNWTLRRNTPPRVPSSTPTGLHSQLRTTTRPDRQRSGGRKSFKLQPVPPVQRIFEPSLTGETDEVPPVPSLLVGLGLQRRQASMSRPSSRASLGSVKSQPAPGHASKPSSMRTMTLGMDGTQLSRRVRDLDDTVMTLEVEKRQATSRIRALQDALNEAYSELHSKSDTSGLKLAGSLTSTPPRDPCSSEPSPLPTEGLAPLSAHAGQSGGSTPTLNNIQRLNSSDSNDSSRKNPAQGPPLTLDASSDTVSPTLD